FVTHRILEPIGMSETVTNLTAIAAGENLASPHGTLGGPMQVVPFDSVDNIEAAGGVVSSVADWSRWMLTQLDSGRIAGTTVWPSAQTRELWSPGIPVPIGDPPPPLLPLRPNFSAYGLGWSLRDYRGVKLVTHDGGLAGMLSRTILVPEKRLGIVIFTNGETLTYQALGWTVLDYYLGAPRTDWTSIIATLGEQAQSTDRAFEDSIQAARHAEIGPSLPLTRLAGRYTDEWYGDVTLALEGDHLVLHWSHSPALVADLEHWQYDTFRARMRTPNVADAFLTFQLKYDGTVDRITMAPVLPSTDFSFNYQDLVFRPGE
ncbi:MAG TPA: serine hydrolase, partial [Gemmatimonadales bacterium]|nr:serine hydrolase [Gemmatimonadales bacterium]